MPRKSRKRKWLNEIGTQTYFAWRSMRSRCRNESNPSYHHYGGRGITVCSQWENDFDAFVADMGFVPPGLTLERSDNELGYTPENCRWASVEDQLNNQRRNVFIQYLGCRLTVAQWAKKLNVRFDTLWRRLKRLPIEQALVAGSLYGHEPEHGTRSKYEKGCRCNACRAVHNKRMREQRARKEP